MKRNTNKTIKWITILFLSIVIISCANKEDRIIKKFCSGLASEISDIKKEGFSYDPYILATQLDSYKNMNVYYIEYCLLQYHEEPIKYTKCFKKDGVYIFIKRPNTVQKTITKDMYEELYNWFDGWIVFEEPIYVLLINPQNYKHVVLDYGIYYTPIDSFLKLNNHVIDSIRIK